MDNLKRYHIPLKGDTTDWAKQAITIEVAELLGADVIAQYHKKRKFMKYLKAVCHGGIEDWDLYALLTYHWKHIFKKIGMPSKAIDLADYLIYENYPEMDVERDTAERID